MAQASNMNTNPPSRRNFQRHISSSVDRSGYRNNRIRTCPTTRDRSTIPVKPRYRIYSSNSSINNSQINQRQNNFIDQHIDSNNVETKTKSIPCPDIDRTSYTINDSTSTSSERMHSQETKSSNLIENAVQVVTRECAICLLDQPLNFFERRYSNQCEHFQRTICDTCIYNIIKSHIENRLESNVLCPEANCIAIFNFESIRYILTLENNLELFEQYDRQLTHEHLEKIQEFVWCAHNGCGSGQFHDMSTYSNPIVTCIKCNKRTCAFHRTVWHIGMTCQEYDQSKISSVDHNTQIWLRKYSKKCPRCQSYIEKISGCDHMTCRKCKYQFCWQCFADYRKIQMYGSKHHREHCSHYVVYRQRSMTCTIL